MLNIIICNIIYWSFKTNTKLLFTKYNSSSVRNASLSTAGKLYDALLSRVDMTAYVLL